MSESVEQPKVPAKRPKGDVTVYDYGDDYGKGSENQGREDTLVPFLGLLQTNSPQVESESIDGAKPGKLINTVTEELYGDSVLFVPALTRHSFVEWIPRIEGGGMVAVHSPESEIVAAAKAASTKFGEYFVPREGGKKNDLAETFDVYGVICDEHNPIEMIVVSFTSTKIKVYKSANTRWQTIMVQAGNERRNPPLWANLVRISTVKQTRNDQSFYNFDVRPANGDAKASLLAPDDPRYQAGKEVYELATQGFLRVDMEQAPATSASQPAADDSDDDGMPF